jgi:hypothetical protein
LVIRLEGEHGPLGRHEAQRAAAVFASEIFEKDRLMALRAGKNIQSTRRFHELSPNMAIPQILGDGWRESCKGSVKRNHPGVCLFFEVHGLYS